MNKQKEAAMSDLDSLKKRAMELLAKAHREERRYSRKAKALEAGYVHPDDEAAVKAIIAALAARQPVAEPEFYLMKADAHHVKSKASFFSQVVALREPVSKGAVPFYAAPPAPAAVPVDQFRDADHLAEWLGSLVAACGQEEWDAAQAAMNGVRAFQNHPDAVERLRAAIEGECDGLAISGQQASAILAHVILPEPDGFFATNPQPAAAKDGE